MSDENAKRTEAESELQREIRAGRKFTLADAIGRMAGPGIMKGVSPIARREQASAQIREYLNQHLADYGGSLQRVLLRRVTESDTLLTAFDHPLAALGGYIRKVLDSEYGLRELVREVDMEWGRQQDERPYFELDGSPPSPDDPYTVESVRTVLMRLEAGLTTGGP
jgi:hypothetical protein